MALTIPDLGGASSVEVIELAVHVGDQVALVVTDLVMPGMSGRELADVLRVRQPGLKVLFLSLIHI